MSDAGLAPPGTSYDALAFKTPLYGSPSHFILAPLLISNCLSIKPKLL